MTRYRNKAALIGAAIGGLLAAQPASAQLIRTTQIVTATPSPTLGNGTARFPISEIKDGIKSDAGPFNGYQGNNHQMGNVAFEFDKAYDVSAFRLWNDINVRKESFSKFTLKFYDAGGNLIPSATYSNSAPTGQVGMQRFGFGVVPNVKKVVLVVQGLHRDTGIQRVEIREVEFEGKPARGQSSAEAYRCYDLMRHTGREENRQFNMVDQFGRTRTLIGHPVQLCNPVALNKRGATPANMARQYKDHLVCYEIFDNGRPGSRQQNVEIKNRLGTRHLGTGHADQVCLVSSKRHVNAPPPPPGSPRARR